MIEITQNWNELLLLATVNLLAAMSPGPDFVMAVRNSVQHGRLAGVATAIGFSLGVGVHLTYIMLGLGVVISQSILLFNILKVVGAGYLFWVGYKALQSKGFKIQEDLDGPHTPYAFGREVVDGFLTNVLNPKATLFFLALFTQIIHPAAGIGGIWAAYFAVCMISTICWFSFVAVVLTHAKIRAQFLRFSKWVDRACGAFFILLGVKLVTSEMVQS